jgi:hypothetical protein
MFIYHLIVSIFLFFLFFIRFNYQTQHISVLVANIEAEHLHLFLIVFALHIFSAAFYFCIQLNYEYICEFIIIWEKFNN